MKLKEVKWSGHVTCSGKKRSSYSRKLPKRRPTHRLGDVNLDHKEIGWEGVEWILLANDKNKWLAHVSTVMNLCIPSKFGMS
jgi:hypothetical protein